MSTDESPQSTASAAADKATQYQVMITMSQETVSALFSGSYYLYGFKAVRGSQGGAAPLVWFQTQQYANSTIIAWTEQYQAYFSMSRIIPGGEIAASFSTDIDLGKTLQVESGGKGNVVDGGSPSAISIINQTSEPYTCGISSFIGEIAGLICAFPLYGNQMDVITPVKQVLLMFSTQSLHPGTVMGLSTDSSQSMGALYAYTQNIMIDFSTSDQRAVSFDINSGWSWGGEPWAQRIPANANLIPLLIQE